MNGAVGAKALLGPGATLKILLRNRQMVLLQKRQFVPIAPLENDFTLLYLKKATPS
jgi:hypothetical protein